MSKQSSTPKPKRTVAKKATTKRPQTAARKTAGKKVAQKTPRATSAKKVAQKKARTNTGTKKRAAKPKTAPKEKTKQSTTNRQSSTPDAEAIILPTNTSLRQQEKATVLREAWRKSFLRIAYSAGLCFVVVGGVLALSHLFNSSSDITSSEVSAQVLSATNSQERETSFQLTSRIPDQIDSSQRITFTATNADNVSATLRPAPCESGFIELPVENLLNGKYRTNVDPKLFAPGYYCLLINIKPSNSSSAFDIQSYGSSKQIQIGPQEYFTEIPAGSDVELERIENNMGFSGEDTQVNGPIERSNTVFAIFANETTLSGVTTIGVSVPESYEFIELYARPIQSLNARFIGLASKRFERFQFVVNTQSRLPNGRYEFFAQAKRPNGEIIKTEGLELRVDNTTQGGSTDANSQDASARPGAPTYIETPESVSPVASPRRPTQEEVANQVATTTSSSAVATRESIARPFLEFDANDASSTDDARNVLQQNRERLTELLQRFAVAQQAEDEGAIKLARAELRSFRNEIIDAALADPALQTTADDLDKELTQRIENLSERVERFESLRRERTSGGSGVDSDGDGISDTDERTLYQTDPNAADSDNDGFTDGVEILRGFNPNNDAPESTVRLESPRDTVGLERSDAIQIETITPVVPLEAVPNQPDVKAQVRGTALPNSFVTLYIFSTPIVVTVKTDADGSFVYTLDKELSDGEHEVFAAVTDNTGEIIAQSRPFPFVKQAQAFTPVDAAEATVVSQQTPHENSIAKTYGTVIGLAILAFGLILIMLGVTLRRTDDPELSTDQKFDIASGRTATQTTDTQA